MQDLWSGVRLGIQTPEPHSVLCIEVHTSAVCLPSKRVGWKILNGELNASTQNRLNIRSKTELIASLPLVHYHMQRTVCQKAGPIICRIPGHEAVVTHGLDYQ